MASIQPFHTLRYDPQAVGGLDRVVAPPYDVIDPEQRAGLVARSPFNVVEIDLPEAEAEGGDAYLHAQTTMDAWRQQGILVREREPALWAMTQEFTTPAGEPAVRRGFFARVRVEDYGPGRIRPHERTHPGPKEDRLRLTRATRTNLSPIFSLFSDPEGAAWSALAPVTDGDPFDTATDADGTVNRLWRVAGREAIEAVQQALAAAELLIADGHHRYETARVYADEIGGEGEHRWVLMYLCALEDPGLTVFPTHRLLDGLDDPKREALRTAVEAQFTAAPVPLEQVEPPAGEPGVAFGYLDGFHRRPLRLTLKDPAAVDEALSGRSEAYRRLDTAVLETLLLRGALGMSEDDISHKHGLDYSRTTAEAIEAVESGRAQAVFFMRSTPVAQVQAVAAAGESMPPKSTFFYPKIPTGLVFNPLE